MLSSAKATSDRELENVWQQLQQLQQSYSSLLIRQSSTKAQEENLHCQLQSHEETYRNLQKANEEMNSNLQKEIFALNKKCAMTSENRVRRAKQSALAHINIILQAWLWVHVGTQIKGWRINFISAVCDSKLGEERIQNKALRDEMLLWEKSLTMAMGSGHNACLDGAAKLDLLQGELGQLQEALLQQIAYHDKVEKSLKQDVKEENAGRYKEQMQRAAAERKIASLQAELVVIEKDKQGAEMTSTMMSGLVDERNADLARLQLQLERAHAKQQVAESRLHDMRRQVQDGEQLLRISSGLGSQSADGDNKLAETARSVTSTRRAKYQGL